MTAIRNTSIGIKDYFQRLKDKAEYDKEKAKISYAELKDIIMERRSAIVPYVDKFRLPIIDYPEFQQNKYINGFLEDAAKSMYQDNRLSLEDKHLHFRLVSYAVSLRKIVEYEKTIEKADKILALTLNDYRDFLREFYTEVQRQLIVEGNGYRLEGKLGWICYNRVLNTGKKMVDFQATKQNKERLIAEGKRVYNKEEAEWCKQNDIEYDGVDATVYKQDVAWYELCLIGCHLPNANYVRIKPVDYRSVETRNYTTEQLYKHCDGDIDKIMRLDVSMKIKLNMCLESDKLLYTKFIRNENQTKSTYGSSSWKNRQRL